MRRPHPSRPCAHHPRSGCEVTIDALRRERALYRERGYCAPRPGQSGLVLVLNIGQWCDTVVCQINRGDAQRTELSGGLTLAQWKHSSIRPGYLWLGAPHNLALHAPSWDALLPCPEPECSPYPRACCAPRTLDASRACGPSFFTTTTGNPAFCNAHSAYPPARLPVSSRVIVSWPFREDQVVKTDAIATAQWIDAAAILTILVWARLAATSNTTHHTHT